MVTTARVYANVCDYSQLAVTCLNLAIAYFGRGESILITSLGEGGSWWKDGAGAGLLKREKGWHFCYLTFQGLPFLHLKTITL